MDDTITLYPSNWLYNASVIGFLKVMAHGLENGENEVEKWLNDDGTVKFNIDIFDKIENEEKPKSLFYYYTYHENDPKISGNTPLYPNFIPTGKKKEIKEEGKRALAKLVSSFKENLQVGEKPCDICGKCLKLESADKELIKFLPKRQQFNMMHDSSIGTSIDSFPNSFWNCEKMLYVCPLCVYLIIHHHIPFFKFYQIGKAEWGEIFLNAPSFKTMWHLNKYSDAVFKNKNVTGIFACSLIEFSQKVYKSLGLWSAFNIEMVIKTFKKEGKTTKIHIDYYSPSFETTRILLNRNISHLITKTKEQFVLEIILSGRYDELMKLCHKAMRAVLSGKSDNDGYISRLRNKDFKNLAEILPELYIKIDKLLNEVI